MDLRSALTFLFEIALVLGLLAFAGLVGDLITRL
jgi:hypothetical protein